ncbi:hypothetical protein EJB05_17455, partial [Eragrostis curvula]
MLSSIPHGHGQAPLHPRQTQGEIMGFRKEIMEYRKEKIRKFMQMEEETDDEFIFVIVPAILEMLNDEKRPVHTSEYTGAKKMREILEGHEKWCLSEFRMEPQIFKAISNYLRREGLLRDTRGVAVEEQLGMFMFMISHNASNDRLQKAFQHSGETIHRHIRAVFDIIPTLTYRFLKLPTSNETHPKIASDPRFWPFFKRKQSQVAAVLQDFVDFRVKQTKNFMDELNVNTKPSEDYSIKNCLAVLESIDELSEMEKAKAAKIFKCEQNREIFLNLKNPEVRLLWIQDEISP